MYLFLDNTIKEILTDESSFRTEELSCLFEGLKEVIKTLMPSLTSDTKLHMVNELFCLAAKIESLYSH